MPELLQELRAEISKLEPGEEISLVRLKDKFPKTQAGELRRLVEDQKDLAGILGASLCRLGEIKRVATTDRFRKYLEDLPPGTKLSYLSIRQEYGYDLVRYERAMIENHDLIEWLGRGQFAKRGGGAELSTAVMKRETIPFSSEQIKFGEGKVQKICSLCNGTGRMILNRSSTGLKDCKYCNGNGLYWGLPDLSEAPIVEPQKEVINLDPKRKTGKRWKTLWPANKPCPKCAMVMKVVNQRWVEVSPELAIKFPAIKDLKSFSVRDYECAGCGHSLKSEI